MAVLPQRTLRVLAQAEKDASTARDETERVLLWHARGWTHDTRKCLVCLAEIARVPEHVAFDAGQREGFSAAFKMLDVML